MCAGEGEQVRAPCFMSEWGLVAIHNVHVGTDNTFTLLCTLQLYSVLQPPVFLLYWYYLIHLYIGYSYSVFTSKAEGSVFVHSKLLAHSIRILYDLP